MVVSSLWKRGVPLYWMAARWLGWAIGGARVLLGIETRVTGMENLPQGKTSPARPAGEAPVDAAKPS